MNAAKTLSIVGLAALLAAGAPAFASADDGGPHDVRSSKTQLAADIQPDRSEVANKESSVVNQKTGLARILWISWLMRATSF